MNLSSHADGEACVIVLPAHVMLTEAPGVRDQILNRIKNGDHRIVLDLHGVEMMDSSGLTVLVSAQKAIAELGGRLALAGPGEDVSSLLEITQLHQIFEIYPSTAEAVRAIR